MDSQQVQRPGNAPSPQRCPLCGQPNQCLMVKNAVTSEVTRDATQRMTNTEDALRQCWCVTQHFPASLLARVPASARNRACICPACAQAAVSE